MSDYFAKLDMICELPITGMTRFILTRLYRYAGDNNEAFPSQERLALETGMQERNLRNHLKALEAAGYIKKIPGRRKVSTYSLDWDYIARDSVDRQWSAGEKGSHPDQTGNQLPVNEEQTGNGMPVKDDDRRVTPAICDIHTGNLERADRQLSTARPALECLQKTHKTHEDPIEIPLPLNPPTSALIPTERVGGNQVSEVVDLGVGAAPDDYHPTFLLQWQRFARTANGGKRKPHSWRAWWAAIGRIRDRQKISGTEAARWLGERIETYVRSSEANSKHSRLFDYWLSDDRFDDEDVAWAKAKGARGLLERELLLNAESATCLGAPTVLDGPTM